MKFEFKIYKSELESQLGVKPRRVGSAILVSFDAPRLVWESVGVKTPDDVYKLTPCHAHDKSMPALYDVLKEVAIQRIKRDGDLRRCDFNRETTLAVLVQYAEELQAYEKHVQSRGRR